MCIFEIVKSFLNTLYSKYIWVPKDRVGRDSRKRDVVDWFTQRAPRTPSTLNYFPESAFKKSNNGILFTSRVSRMKTIQWICFVHVPRMLLGVWWICVLSFSMGCVETIAWTLFCEIRVFLFFVFIPFNAMVCCDSLL